MNSVLMSLSHTALSITTNIRQGVDLTALLVLGLCGGHSLVTRSVKLVA